MILLPSKRDLTKPEIIDTILALSCQLNDIGSRHYSCWIKRKYDVKHVSCTSTYKGINILDQNMQLMHEFNWNRISSILITKSVLKIYLDGSVEIYRMKFVNYSAARQFQKICQGYFNLGKERYDLSLNKRRQRTTKNLIFSCSPRLNFKSTPKLLLKLPNQEEVENNDQFDSEDKMINRFLIPNRLEYTQEFALLNSLQAQKDRRSRLKNFTLCSSCNLSQNSDTHRAQIKQTKGNKRLLAIKKKLKQDNKSCNSYKIITQKIEEGGQANEDSPLGLPIEIYEDEQEISNLEHQGDGMSDGNSKQQDNQSDTLNEQHPDSDELDEMDESFAIHDAKIKAVILVAFILLTWIVIIQK